MKEIINGLKQIKTRVDSGTITTVNGTETLLSKQLAKMIESAINYTHSCEELLCVKEDVDGLTAGKYYVELHKDKTHTKVVDDYGIETMYFSDRFVKPPKQ